MDHGSIAVYSRGIPKAWTYTPRLFEEIWYLYQKSFHLHIKHVKR